jgi:hypothetical protein
MFFNKTFNLAYGMYLKDELKRNPTTTIVAFKRPSILKLVKFKELLHELYHKTKITKDKDLDKQFKKIL